MRVLSTVELVISRCSQVARINTEGKLMEVVSRRLLRWSFLAVLADCAKALES
jgi:hypothetical protein